MLANMRTKLGTSSRKALLRRRGPYPASLSTNARLLGTSRRFAIVVRTVSTTGRYVSKQDGESKEMHTISNPRALRSRPPLSLSVEKIHGKLDDFRTYSMASLSGKEGSEVRSPKFYSDSSYQLLRKTAYSSANLVRFGIRTDRNGCREEQQFQWDGSFCRPQLAFFSTETSVRQQDDEVAPKSSNETPPAKGTTAVTKEPVGMKTTTNRPIPSRRIGVTRVPTPPSAPADPNPLEQLKQTTPKSILRKGLDLTISLAKMVFSFLIKLPGNFFFYATHPSEIQAAWDRLKEVAKHEANHYWVGTKLLWADIQTARKLLKQTLSGNSLTRRERKQLLRTVSDLFRLIPFSMFVLIPFMEFALPFALRLFPNMLPSTYQDSLKAEENMKRELKSRIAMAQFFQETMEELAKEQKRRAKKRKEELEEAGVDLAEEGDLTIDQQRDSAQSMLEFLEKSRKGEMMPPDVIVRYANYFEDDLTLDNMPRMQLINMCKYMGIQPYGSDAFLRFQLRHRIRVLKEDDQRILWEGINSLTKMELREACQERGMRSTGLSKEAYKHALQQWLDLSVQKNVPIALLIMSRTFFLREDMFERKPATDEKSLSGLADAISGMDKEILNEVILEVATSEEKKSDPDVRKIKLEVLSQQNELIRAEAEEREAAAKQKEAAEKEQVDAAPAEAVVVEAKVEPPISYEQPVVAAATENTGALHTKDSEVPVSAVLDETKKAELVEDQPQKEEEEERELSTEEMDAISQLISDDPVSKEREELERIKAAIKGEEDALSEGSEEAAETDTAALPVTEQADYTSVEHEATETISPGEEDQKAKETIEKMDEEVSMEAEASTKVALDDHKEPKPAEEHAGDVEEDPTIARLKKRIESMVDKIEVQLTETKVKIGDKLHHLDKDRDGIMTKEELAGVLQQVLKRSISEEEAMHIASDIDANADGVCTVDELLKWIHEHKLVKFVEEGRDADVDRMIEGLMTSQSKPKEEAVAYESNEKNQEQDTSRKPQERHEKEF